MDKRIVDIKIGGVPPEIKPKWLVAAIVANSEDLYTLITASRIEILQRCGLGVNICLEMLERDIKGLSDELSLADGRRLNVVINGHLPLCHRCQSQGHFKDCSQVQHSKVNMKAARE